MNLRHWLVVGGLSLVAAAPCQAGFNFGARGAFNLGTWALPSYPAGASAAFQSGFGGHVSAGYDFLDWVGVEIGAGFMQRNGGFSGTILGVAFNGSFGTSHLFFPVQAAFTPIKYLKLLVGAYYSLGVGNVSTTITVPSLPSTTNTSSSYTGANMSASDIGLIGTVRGMYPILPMLSIVADVRYALGLLNVSTAAGTSSSYRNLEFLAGAQFNLL